jgi:hypothetical protein
MKEEGWFQDPFGVHQDRWISDGHPTALVRDNGVESHDPPPSGPDDVRPSLVRSVAPSASGPDDLRRADESAAASDRAWEVMAEFEPPR